MWANVKRFKILLDLSSIKSGGGAQLALNFCDQMKSSHCEKTEWFAYLPARGPLSGGVDNKVFSEVIKSKNSLLARWAHENWKLRKFIVRNEIDAVFTFFGAGVPTPKNVLSIVSVAYPIICYPDSPYWGHVPPLEGLKKRIINVGRRLRIKRADLIIVETEVMRQRLAAALGVDRRTFKIVQPTVSQYLGVPAKNKATGPFRILFLSGTDQHKNLWRLARVAKILERSGAGEDVLFVLSTTKAAFELGLKRMGESTDFPESWFEFKGAIDPREISKIYEQIDCVANLSDLESFSNNYMEAWQAQKCLITSDRDFARAICGESAEYVEPHCAESIVAGIGRLRDSENLRKKLTDAGTRKLRALPTPAEKFHLLCKILIEQCER